MLALRSDSRLSQLAKQDNAAPTEPEDQVELGGGWWDVQAGLIYCLGEADG